jgi:tripartite-type tricarboxylate transporter receptor subunit TctC
MKTIVSVLITAFVALGPYVASAQATYPQKPIRMIVGFSAGSATDITARLFAQRFSEAWNVPVTVENIPGAGGSVAAARAAKADPDGYTLMYAGYAALAIVPTLQRVAYDPVKDFAPISITVRMPSVLAVNNDLPANNVRELIALAKNQPGKLSFASPGTGTPQHLTGEMIKASAGIDLVHVPYRGAQLADVISGRVPITIQAAGAVASTLRDGKLRGLAVTSLQRSPNIPELPTLAESGFEGFDATSWFVLVAPSRTPQEVIERVHAESVKIARDPDLRERFASLWLEPVGSSPAEAKAALEREVPLWAKVIKDADVEVGN